MSTAMHCTTRVGWPGADRLKVAGVRHHLQNKVCTALKVCWQCHPWPLGEQVHDEKSEEERRREEKKS